MFKVFYSWQSDRPSRTNRGLIEDALIKACAALQSEGGIVVEPVVDRDTQGLAGAPAISDAIFSKIREADAFVADVSLINVEPRSPENSQPREAPLRPTPNPNVLVELGYALAHLGNEQVVLVMNTHFGPVEQLPFDLRPLRTLAYQSAPDDSSRADIKKTLGRALATAIKDIANTVRSDPVHEIIYPRTLQVAAIADETIREFITAVGGSTLHEQITEAEFLRMCEQIDPFGQARLILGGDSTVGFKYATWLEAMWYWRERSRRLTTDILVFSPFLKREHVALLAMVEQCQYFGQLANIRAQNIANKDFGWISGSIWRYILVARRLKQYAEMALARKAEKF